MFERSWKLGEGAGVSSANLNRLTHYMYITIVHHEKIVLVRSGARTRELPHGSPTLYQLS